MSGSASSTRPIKPKPSRLKAYSFRNAGALLVLYMIEHLIAERTLLTTILTYMPQLPFLLPTALLLVLSLVKKRPRLITFNSSALAFSLVFVMGFNIPIRNWFSAAHATPSSTKLRVLTYNVEFGQRGAANIGTVVRKYNPDVVCLQETAAFRRFASPLPALKNELRPDYPYIENAGDVTTFSKFPIRESQSYVLPTPLQRHLLRTQIDMNGQAFTIWNAHLSMEPIDNAEYYRLWRLPFFLRLGGSSKTRMVQAKFILSQVTKTKTPYILCGDFNTPPRGKVYGQLASQLTDSFRTVSWGCGHSFRSDLPLIRIDYVWTSSKVQTLDGTVLNEHASDHRPYLVDLAIN